MNNIFHDRTIDERLLIYVWDNGCFYKDNLRTKDGREIKIINKGQCNEESGADFHNAEIMINGKLYKGDVEIHLRSSDWRAHHHDRNSKYNNTILHVALWDSGISLLTKKQNGEHIPTLILHDYLDRSINRLWKDIEGKNIKGKCNNILEPPALMRVLDKLGMERFSNKAKTFEEVINEENKDQILYEGIMTALGYSRNKHQFLELANKVSINMLIGKNPEEIQAILFGVSGLLPTKIRYFNKETKEYIKKIKALWHSNSSLFIQRMSYDRWEFFRVRPDNFPTRRIAGISYILNNCNSLVEMFIPALKDNEKILEILMPRSNGYWAFYYTFGSKKQKEMPYLIGRDRANDILVNVILPFLLAYSKYLKDKNLQDFIMKKYSSFNKLQDNKITKYFADRVFNKKENYISKINSAVRQQGLIALYKLFCINKACDICPIVKT
ncbi:MAG: DUF2851 family protein [bacterium]